jgi:hypothetical protein
MTRVHVQSSQELLDFLDRRPVAQLILRPHHMEPAEAVKWEGRLNGLLDDCGCDAGAAGFIGGLSISIGVLVWSKPSSISVAMELGIATVAALSAAVVGKLLGRWTSRQRARREGAELAGTLAVLESRAPRQPR